MNDMCTFWKYIWNASKPTLANTSQLPYVATKFGKKAVYRAGLWADTAIFLETSDLGKRG